MVKEQVNFWRETYLTTENSLWFVNPAPEEAVTKSTNTILHVLPPSQSIIMFPLLSSVIRTLLHNKTFSTINLSYKEMIINYQHLSVFQLGSLHVISHSRFVFDV